MLLLAFISALSVSEPNFPLGLGAYLPLLQGGWFGVDRVVVLRSRVRVESEISLYVASSEMSRFEVFQQKRSRFLYPVEKVVIWGLTKCFYWCAEEELVLEGELSPL